MRQVFALSSLALLCVLTLAPAAYPQVSTSDVTGTISDQAGAVVSGATITVKNTATGLERRTVTGDTGDYLISSLPPGEYEVKVEASGFSTVVQRVALEVGRRITLNFTLKPGVPTEVITVEADAPLIETTKSEIGGVVTPVEVQSLPLLNRTFAALSVVMPEARPVGNFDPTKTRVGNFAMNGGDGRQLDVNVDGGDNKDNVVGSLLQNFAYEGIQEFQVLQHRWTAESGRAVGGVINVVTKSGSNDWHGSFFSNFRDEQLRTKDFFENQSTAAKPTFSRQEIGGSFGGPVVKEKLFFFGTLERFRERQNNLVVPSLLPQLRAIPGVNVVEAIPTPYNDWLFTAKVDHRITDKQSMFYRYSQQNNESPNDQIGVPANSDLNNGNTNDNTLYSFVVNHNYAISANKLNTISFQYQDFTNEILGVTDQPQLAFPSVVTGKNTNVPQATLETKYQFRDDFSWQVDRHSLKFGANYIYTDMGGFFFFGAQGYALTFFDDPLTIKNNTNGLYPQGFATPGAVRNLTFSDGVGNHDQTLHQVALYFQDDFKLSPKFTLNLGLRWDANIDNLVDQTRNRAILVLQKLNHPLARAITGDQDKLTRTTPNWKEFQPRFGFAYDPKGDGRTVIRGGYGIFFDQLFQNLTLFSLVQSGAEIYQTALNLTNNRVGEGQLATYRFGVDPLPTPAAGFSFADLATGGFGRINDPDASEPYVQKFSIGFQHSLSQNWVLSSDYVHTLGVHEPRVQVINPRIGRICNPAYPGSTPTSALCVRGASSRVLDRAFVDAGLPANRLEQINMIGTTNRSLFDSWTIELRGRMSKMTLRAAYVLSNSRAWGGQPVASYSGNGIAVVPENQFRPEEFGPTRIDERHRIVVSGVFDLPWGFQLAPILQYSSARPYSLNTGFDLDGDGLATIDRICANVDPNAVFAVRGDLPKIQALNPFGCQQRRVNTQRRGFIVDASGNVESRSGRYFNVDLRATKAFRIGETFKLSGYVDLYNLFDTENLSFASRLGLSAATSRSRYMQPFSLYGPGFGPPVGRPLTAQLGFRLDF